MGTIHSLAVANGKSTHRPPYQFTRQSMEQVKLVANYGIEGDSKAKPNSPRQLNIMCLEKIQPLTQEGYKTRPGELGEQIVITGLDLTPLPVGTRLRLGSDAVIEITEHRNGCGWFEKVQDKSKDIDLGIMAKVLQSGTVHLGDSVEIAE